MVLHRQPQVRPVKAGDHLAVVPHSQLGHDVATYRKRRSSGQRDHRRMIKAFNHRTETEIIRPEVITPGRHAMRLVHDEQGNTDPTEPLDYFLLGQLLRRQKEVLGLTLVYGLPGAPVLS